MTPVKTLRSKCFLTSVGQAGTALAAVVLAVVNSPPSLAQPADLPIPAATTNRYPPGVRVTKSDQGPVYANSEGSVLYGMDMRTLLRFGSDPSLHCTGTCAEAWEPLLAPAGSQPNIRFPAGFAVATLLLTFKYICLLIRFQF